VQEQEMEADRLKATKPTGSRSGRVQSAHMLFGRQINKTKEEIYSKTKEVERLKLELNNLNEQVDLKRKQLDEIEEQRAMRTRPKHIEEQDANLPAYTDLQEHDSPEHQD
jgi:regulator of replication initiation timing